MSGGIKAVLGLVVLVILVGGGWYLYKNMDSNQAMAPADQTATTTDQQAAVQPPPNLITSNDTSDAGLAADLSAIDAQISVVAQDAVAADAGLNDKQVTQ